MLEKENTWWMLAGVLVVSLTVGCLSSAPAPATEPEPSRVRAQERQAEEAVKQPISMQRRRTLVLVKASTEQLESVQSRASLLEDAQLLERKTPPQQRMDWKSCSSKEAKEEIKIFLEDVGFMEVEYMSCKRTYSYAEYRFRFRAPVIRHKYAACSWDPDMGIMCFTQELPPVESV